MSALSLSAVCQGAPGTLRPIRSRPTLCSTALAPLLALGALLAACGGGADGAADGVASLWVEVTDRIDEGTAVSLPG